MQDYGRDSVVSGQLADWGVMYEKIFRDIYDNKWSNADMWWLAAENAIRLGGRVNEIINPKFIDDLKAVEVTYLNKKITVYDLVLLQYAEMKKTPVTFDPFSGPTYDNKGILQIKEGEIATKDDLLSMMYYVDNVVGKIPETD